MSAYSLVMIMDSTRQSSDKDAGTREVDHFTQIVFHTERNHKHLEDPGKQLDICAIFSSLVNTTQGWNFPGTPEHRGIFPTLLLTCYGSSAKTCHTLSLTYLGKAVISSLGIFVSHHHYLPCNAPLESLMTAKGAQQKPPTSVPSLERSQPQPKFKMPLKARPQVCGWSGLSVV